MKFSETDHCVLSTVIYTDLNNWIKLEESVRKREKKKRERVGERERERERERVKERDRDG